ncbi:hypothetical protein [Streptomyces fradiae]|uniref:hypothetical protein n=1 Tax=Streptomyces fradiae TaxID=1906 RepID=UPI003515A2D9
MTVHQLPADIAAFTGWLSELAGRLEPGQGWYGVFAARDPEGMRACFGGTDILPWDVAESLLQDLGEPVDGPRALRGRALHRAAAAAHDQGPGGAAALTERRALMAEEIRYAEQRIRELSGRPDPDGALYWAQDDHARATARVAELTERLERLQRLERPEPPEPVRRRPRGARYAWVAEEPEPVVNPVGEPAAGPVPAAAPLAAPRGARFAPAPADPAPPADITPGPGPGSGRGRPRRARRRERGLRAAPAPRPGAYRRGPRPALRGARRAARVAARARGRAGGGRARRRLGHPALGGRGPAARPARRRRRGARRRGPDGRP